MRTGENEQGLKKVIDLTRMISIVILLIHCYYFGYAGFKQIGWVSVFSDHLLQNIGHIKWMNSFTLSKTVALGFLLLSVLGVKGKKEERYDLGSSLIYLLMGLLIYFASGLLFYLHESTALQIVMAYTTAVFSGFLLVITGSAGIARIIKVKLNTDTFNTAQETFPQEERLLANDHSINLRAHYKWKGETRASWINIINPMRGLLIVGSPGAGKSYFIIEQIIEQHIKKGFCLFIYDFKFDDLTRVAHDWFCRYKHIYPANAAFYTINFDQPQYRCNPLDPAGMKDITDAIDAARVLMLGLNRSWLKKQGEFFVESPINFVTALIWFLRKYQDGVYCTLPHVIELMQTEVKQLLTILRTEPEISALINPFISAFETKSFEQLEGQLDAAKISLARLASPSLYYVLSGNDFTLDINNPAAPKIVTLANNPQKQEVYGPVLSLYVTRMSKMVNKKDQLKMNVIIDEFPTIILLNFDNLIATGRSNKIATTIAIQDASQLKLHYGREWAEVITNICGNIIVGQTRGELAKAVSEMIGKTLQERESISVNSNDSSISKSRQLESVVPVSTIANLSSGEFVGMVADNPDQPIVLKAFHAKIGRINEHRQKQSSPFQTAGISQKELTVCFELIQLDIKQLVEELMNDILNDPAKEFLVVR
ncbi:conjugal transfer protein MobC [Pinibacter aurantiacus]|uniref:YWFCY domain-containing protein n=1 Tax=Pinibacter aurantiacus TaxID=2851599 RepID=A0A9E2SAU8_9BACT|nr:conjugal transfer protein MobC [Pinibacter aurantiacus]MBV4358767.1 YWFCY domain-containing protein [Pinibacter aurantiacus]